MTKEVDALKTQRKAVKHHLTIVELPEAERFKQLSTQRKNLIDTIKMVAYRAESAMTQMARETMHREGGARSFLRALYSTEADLLPDANARTLTVRVHHQANRCAGLDHNSGREARRRLTGQWYRRPSSRQDAGTQYQGGQVGRWHHVC